MQDTSIKGNGTSRFIKGASSFPSSFEEFRRQIVAGTLTADIGLNPAGCDVVGTALSKANLLTDDVANRLGLAESKTVNEALNKLFTFAADGKKNCAAAVSAMGVPTAEGATFDTIAANIRSIKTGSDVSGVTATAADVRDDKTFVTSSGVLTQGKSPVRHTIDIQTTPGSLNFMVPYGTYPSNIPKTLRDDNLKPEYIVSGNKIFGVSGTARHWTALWENARATDPKVLKFNANYFVKGKMANVQLHAVSIAREKLYRNSISPGILNAFSLSNDRFVRSGRSEDDGHWDSFNGFLDGYEGTEYDYSTNQYVLSLSSSPGVSFCTDPECNEYHVSYVLSWEDQL